MTIFKCKMCGGTLEINNNESVAECEYCGTQQTLPNLNDERKANLYDRANHFRRNNEFDKAEGIYEQILNEDNTDAEAYWSLVLCRYGIEYVEDLATYKRVPTVNRAQFTSVYDDDNYKSALQYADISQKVIYEKEANTINEIQKGILAISQKEEPFDVFICYKETDNNGRRTPDSVLANDLYHQLTQEGFKVFFSRITLEDKLGSAYEPYIFAALNSAKVMVVLGTKPEYFKAVWIRNEWSRYLSLIKQGQNKMLIPAYKDMDPYDLPEEFSHLQAQDMSKLGFMQDLIRGIKKITQVEQPKATVVKEMIVSDNNANVAPLLKRAFMFLEDKEWDSADEYCEKVLDIEPECAEAYLGKLMVELKVSSKQDLKNCLEPFSKRNNFQKIMRFADENLQSELQGYIDYIVNRNLENAYKNAVHMMNVADAEDDYKKAAGEFQKLQEYKDSKHLYQECLDKAEEARLTRLYDTANSLMYNAEDEYSYKIAAEHFGAIKTFKDAAEKENLCFEKAEISRKDEIYNFANFLMQDKTVASYRQAIEQFKSIVEWKDSSSKIGECEQGINEVQQREEAERVEKARIAEEKRQKEIKTKEDERKEAERIQKRNKKIVIIAMSIVCVIIAFIIVLKNIVIPNGKYNDAVDLMEAGHYAEAISVFDVLDGYKDSINKIEECNINIYGEEGWNKIKGVNVGDTYQLGSYEQDNNISNGRENIDWLVLFKEGTRILVISKKALVSKQYNDGYSDIYWETCTLRKWLNNEFIREAFSDDEKEMIPSVTVSADKSTYPTNPGNETQDQIFLLSIAEVNMYFNSNIARQCEPTEYAVSCGTQLNNDNKCSWWLRSPGNYQSIPARVSDDGSIVGDGHGIIEEDFGDFKSNIAVRPAMWIDLNHF